MAGKPKSLGWAAQPSAQLIAMGVAAINCGRGGGNDFGGQ